MATRLGGVGGDVGLGGAVGGWRDDFIAGGRVCGGAMEGNSVVTPCGLHSGLRQSGTQSSQKRDDWGTRVWATRPARITQSFVIVI
jgi:hypothetical protein